jgi:hypothetical protein
MLCIFLCSGILLADLLFLLNFSLNVCDCSDLRFLCFDLKYGIISLKGRDFPSIFPWLLG